jgi:hypothetical protein
MKRSCLLILVLCLATTLTAQVTKGNFLAGGSLSFQSIKYTESEFGSTIFKLMPTAGYFFIDRVAAGLKVSFAHQSNHDDDYRDLLAGPFARYYFLPVTKSTNIFLEGHFMAGSEKYNDFDASDKTQFGFSAGPVFFLNPHIGVETAVNWSSLKYGDSEGRFNVFGISVGFQVHLNCKREKEGK